jgi:hypothetical protein
MDDLLEVVLIVAAVGIGALVLRNWASCSTQTNVYNAQGTLVSPAVVSCEGCTSQVVPITPSLSCLTNIFPGGL